MYTEMRSSDPIRPREMSYRQRLMEIGQAYDHGLEYATCTTGGKLLVNSDAFVEHQLNTHQSGLNHQVTSSGFGAIDLARL